MNVLVDNTSSFGRYSPGPVRRQIHAAMNEIYKAGWLGRRIFGRLRGLERMCSSQTREIVDVERFGLYWRLYRRGNVSDSRLLLRPEAFEATEIKSIIDLVHPGFAFVDIGANCGFYSLRISRALVETATGTGRVIAIEPHPGMGSVLPSTQNSIPLFQFGYLAVLSAIESARPDCWRAIATSGKPGFRNAV